MTSVARVEFDPMMMGIRIALMRDHGGGTRDLFQWEAPSLKRYDAGEVAAEPGDADWLRLQDEDARALYEALADYFGHAGHDTRALRKDYDAERGRVDGLIAYLTRSAL